VLKSLIWPAFNVFESRHEDSKGLEHMTVFERSEA
jgi:hypothetical protein